MSQNNGMKKIEQELATYKKVINNQGSAMQQMHNTINSLKLQISQLSQILEQYRSNIYNDDLKIILTIKLLEEKGILLSNEFDKRWPMFLKNDIGVKGENGIMEGSLKVNFYGVEEDA